MEIPRSKFTANRLGWILAALIVLCGSAILMNYSVRQATKKSGSSNSDGFFLNYYFLRKDSGSDVKVSFNPKDSDLGFHETILNSLIGTLVKFGSSGKIEPYLASALSFSNEGRQLNFELRRDLICEDGSVIDAPSFKANLERSLRLYSENSNVLDFELLLGWDNFKIGTAKTLDGLKASSQSSLSFTFTRRPEDFIEFLRMPYFGFWCDSNFADGKWRDDQKIISSGPYRLTSVDGSQRVTVSARNNWFSITPESPQNIGFQFLSVADLSTTESPSVIETLSRDEVSFENMVVVSGTPTILFSLILSPYKDGPFKHVENRRAFAQRVRRLQSSHPKFNAKAFYPSGKNAAVAGSYSYGPEMRGVTIDIAFHSRNYTPEEKLALEELVSSALKDSGATPRYSINDPLENNWRSRLLSNQEFDMRFNGVDIGGQVMNLVLKMIFCSNMGVSYPDPSGTICSLVTEQDNNNGPIEKDYVDKFEQAIVDDACVLPLMHHGNQWLLSNDINPHSLSPVVSTPLFESVVLK